MKATLLPIPEKEVDWIRYTGENLEEVKEFCKKIHKDKKIFIDTGESKTLYWETVGIIRIGDFVVYGYIEQNFYKHERIISWKTFPRMIKEEIPVFMNDYLKWEEENKHIRE